MRASPGFQALSRGYWLGPGHVCLSIVLGACSASEEPNFGKPWKRDPGSSPHGQPSQADSKPGERKARPAKGRDPNKETPGHGSGANKEYVDGYELIRARPADQRADKLKAQKEQRQAKRLLRVPNQPDPHQGTFTLPEAVKGLPKKGSLLAHIETRMGTFDCELFEKKAPITVANFIGLARGLRKYWDARQGEWVAGEYFNGTPFHRVIPGFMIQGGDYLGNGSGTTGYEFPDELHPSLKHDKAGLLCMANRGPNTNSAQFFITDAAAPHLDHSYTIFGRCEPTDLVYRIARVPQAGPPTNRPLDPVVIERVRIQRVKGGIAKARQLRSERRQQHAEQAGAPRGASKGPSAIRKSAQRADPTHR